MEEIEDKEDEFVNDDPTSLAEMTLSLIEELFIYPESEEDIKLADRIYQRGFQKHCSFNAFASSPLFRKLKELPEEDWYAVFANARKKRDWLCEWERNFILRNFGKFELGVIYDKLSLWNILLASDVGHPSHRAVKESMLNSGEILGAIAREKTRRKSSPKGAIQ